MEKEKEEVFSVRGRAGDCHNRKTWKQVVCLFRVGTIVSF